MDFVKINKTRRNRGYSFERWVVEQMVKRNYKVRRLGGATTSMPDIAATIHNKYRSDAIMFECKSKKDVNTIWVPYDEVLRCHSMLEMFEAFMTQSVVLAFKFPKIIKNGQTKRKLEYRFVEIDGFDIELEDLIIDIGYNLKKEQVVFHWKDFVNQVGYPQRGEDYDWTIYKTLDDLLNHLGQFHTENKELWLAQHN